MRKEEIVRIVGSIEHPVERALVAATLAHLGQKDKSGQPYILHPIRVAMIIQKEFATYPEKLPEGFTVEDLMIAAFLHDAAEDTEFGLYEIEALWGTKIYDIVDAVTRRTPPGKPKEVYMDFIRRAKKHPAGRIVKIADLHHNMSRINNLPVEERDILDRYLRAERILNDVE
jgi:(p)ppGpp synthase/HD superfamily hydrolase